MRGKGRAWRRMAVALAGLACVLVTACAPPEPPEAEGRLNVVATIGMIRDVAENVGGPYVNVTGLMGPGVDPHLYKASEGDVRRLFRADVIFYGGLHLEARMGEVLHEMGSRTRVAAVSEVIPVDRRLAPPEFQGAYDPHVWFDVRLWAMTVDVIEHTLSQADPAHARDFAANAARYRRQLDELDRYVRAQAARVPPERRVLITAHDAFNYFGRAYGFQVRGLQGISTAAEAGTADVQGLAEFIATRRIPAIFVESSIPRRTIEAVQEAVAARGYEVRIGGSLYSDAMGNPGTPDGTYIGMVRHNIDTIVGALLRQP
ncbi:metal ABC transporter solute-binding protein, Zn/Mn family [Longimicrobium sp.]|uniref:metal ABC transporter solute-binding protein, Zn/Mn family n=1 Tax=Longimicrobium sp. TaxID=2029185 RepID=UPI002E348A90|nr:zinc ABC transporter substrate-binding protein [Longimicrobium sp.]HEX6039360.1 zinc ABC transporter substrate-binding protein [Longimicrobium sp.]